MKAWLIHYFYTHDMASQFDVDSCGVFAPFKLPPSKEAIAVMQERGIDISAHKSKPISATLINEADKIIVMTPEHKFSLQETAVVDESKILVLHIADPIGKGKVYYEKTFEDIQTKIKENINWIIG